MIDATLLMKDTEVFSPWFSRQTDMLRATAECVASNNATIKIELYTKNVSAVGNGVLVDSATFLELSSAGRSTAEWKTVVSQEGVQQLLRFKYTVTSGSDSLAWILFRLLPAVWFDAVKVS